MNIPKYLYSLIYHGKEYFFTMADLNKFRPLVNRILDETGQRIISYRYEVRDYYTATYVNDNDRRIVVNI